MVAGILPLVCAAVARGEAAVDPLCAWRD
jgi:hypothetical protein